MPDIYHSLPDTCEYLPEKTWRHMVFWLSEVTPHSFDQLLEMGFRHFGHYFFRNDCLNCNACNGLRVDTQLFELSKSQKRLSNKNKDLKCVPSMGSPNLTDKPLVDLWQREREHHKDWASKAFSPNEFKDAFAELQGITHTLRVYDSANKLIALSIIDKGKQASNSIYAVFHPDEAHRSLGTWLGIKEIEWAKSQGISHHYFGHYNEQCDSLRYKERFRPYQLSNYESLSRNDVLKILASLPEFSRK